MATTVTPQASRIATAAGTPASKAALVAKYAGRTPSASVSQAWAPAWFYSALNWLGRSYDDANGAAQGFASFMAGSDVDPYQALGATRLFVIAHGRESYRLSLAADAHGDASTTGGTSYPATDEGIRQMYVALADSAIFRRVRVCYIPGRLGSDLDATRAAGPAGTGSAPALESGYDPATGLRTLVLGSAVAQAVPLDDFLNGHNRQIYDAAPAIVPLVSALVYDVTHYNVLGAKSFVLPVYYGRDQVTAGRFMVNRFAMTGEVAGSPATYGQTAVFPGGPGYDEAAATALRLQATSAVSLGNRTLTTYTFDTARVTTISTVQAKVRTGVMSLTYASSMPSEVFAAQAIVGFYRASEWGTALGIPIYDFGAHNGAFKAAATPLGKPAVVYDPAHPFLNGGTLPNVVQKLRQASPLHSTDRLQSILDAATGVREAARGPGLAVATALLDFEMSSPPGGEVAEQLDIPVMASVTTTPTPVVQPRRRGAVARPEERPEPQPGEGAARPASGTISRSVGAVAKLHAIGIGGNAPPPPLPPSVVQAGLTGFIPREALDGTGITSVAIGTAFADQSLGEGDAFKTQTAGIVLNLMAGTRPAFAPIDLPLTEAGVAFKSGVLYVLSLAGTALTVRGSDGSAAAVTLEAGGDDVHTFVGAFIHAPAVQSARLHPRLSLSLAAPAAGTNGIEPGESYSVRLTYGSSRTNTRLDVLDSGQTEIASLTVATPRPTDDSTPRAGDHYFGSFIGGAGSLTVWSVPVFVPVRPADLSGAGFGGAMTLRAQASGIPAYRLKITDSSLYIFYNLGLDAAATTTNVGVRTVFLASATINASPDDRTSRAFRPCPLFLGVVRQVRIGARLRYAFVPSDDSVVIAGKRYMLSIIPLEARDDDPNARPYPPVFWPGTKYWQFANRHNPYLDVHYSGATQDARTARAEAESAKIGLATEAAGEPMHMYLDTDDRIVWPIFPFPVAAAGQSVDSARLGSIVDTVQNILKTEALSVARESSGALDSERVTVPSSLMRSNPYVVARAPAADGAASVPGADAGGLVAAAVAEPVIAGVQVKNLAMRMTTNLAVDSPAARQSARVLQQERGQVAQAQMKSDFIVGNVEQAHALEVEPQLQASQSTLAPQGQFFQIYGFSVVNPAMGEAYIVEIVRADLAIPDRLPDPTTNTTYDPYYVRVVFLKRRICFNMSIIVPSMAYDQYGHFGTVRTPYVNLLSKTNEIRLGYLHTLYDTSNNFDNLNFTPADVEALRASMSPSGRYLYTNLPYHAEQVASFSPRSLFSRFAGESAIVARTFGAFDSAKVSFTRRDKPPLYFLCRRLNWNADCHLMQATHQEGSSVYLAFGAGDIVPLRLDADFAIDKRFPAHMYKLTSTFADRQYESVETLSVANKPYVVAVANEGLVPRYVNFSINATAGTADLAIGNNVPLGFPTEIHVVGQASTTLTSIDAINQQLGTSLTSTGDFFTMDAGGNPLAQKFQVVTYNSLVYLIRAVSNVPALGAVGVQPAVSGLLIDTFVPATTGNLALAQGARYKRSGLRFFGSSYTPSTMVDTLDTLDFTSISGETFYAPTIFIPIPELDATKGFVANLSNFLGQQIWTLIYPEIVAQEGETVNGVAYPNGLNLDAEGKPTLSLQKLQFVYDPMVVLFTPNDLAHKYPLLPKQQVLALTNDQIREGICWRSANVQPGRRPPSNICAQQILPDGDGMDRPNIVYSPHNRPVKTPADPAYMGMSVSSFVSVAGCVYAIEEAALKNDQTATGFISQVSSTTNLLLGVLFDYDNNDLGTLKRNDRRNTTKGIVFLNGYLGATGYAFSSPDHFDVNDVLPANLPRLEQVTGAMGVFWDIAFYNLDISLPEQFWSLAYDSFTAPGLPNFIADVPPSEVDPAFTNRTRSLILSLQNPLHPTDLGLLDTYSSVVSANVHLVNGVTGSVFLSKKADRDIANIGTNPPANADQLFGLETKYDFFVFSRDHYWTLKNAKFELVDEGYAMYLVDDGTGTGTRVAQYHIDADGNYYELFRYVLFSNDDGIIETRSFALKVALSGSGNSVNPTDMVEAINRVSDLIYAAFGPSQPGLPAATIPIQAVGGGSGPQANPIGGAPGANGYRLNVMTASHQPMSISQIFVGGKAYPFGGPTMVVPRDPETGEPPAYLGSLSHGLDRQVQVALLQRNDPPSSIPRTTVPAGPAAGTYGGNGVGSLIGTPFSVAFQGSGAVPPAIAGNPNPGTTMPADDKLFYTLNAASGVVMDSNGNPVTATGGQYFIDDSDSTNPIYGVVTLPRFTLNGNVYAVNLGTTLADGVTSRYTLVVAGRSYPFGPDNAHVTVDRTTFTFNPPGAGVHTVTLTALDAPAGAQAPAPIMLTPFSLTAGGKSAVVDVFNSPGGLANIVTGVLGRQYGYDSVLGFVTVTEGAATTTVKLRTGVTFASKSGYGYAIGFADGSYTVNGEATYPYAASTTAESASYALMTAPQMFTLDGNFYVFDQDRTGSYVSVTGNGQTTPINPTQFSILGQVYIIDSHDQPHKVIGGGNVYAMGTNNTHFKINGVQYTRLGRTVSGQFNLIQGNVVTIENYVYQLDTLNGRIVGNGTAYPLATSGFTYTITTFDRSFTVTTEPNATTVTLGNVVYLINNTTVVGDGITYPILPYRTFVDGASKFIIGSDGTASIAPPFALSGSAPFRRSTFTDGAASYTVNDVAAFDGTSYFRIDAVTAQFTDGAATFALRNDGVSIAAGPTRTHIVNTAGPVIPTQFTFGSRTIFFNRARDVAAFDGTSYFEIANNQFTDTNTGLTWTLSGNTAVNAGNSYEIFSNLGEGGYFQVPGGPTYYVNIAVADTGSATGDIFNVFPISQNQFAIPLAYTITVAGSVATVNAFTFAAPTAVATLAAAGGALTGGFFQDPITLITYTCVVDAGQVTFVDSSNATYRFPAAGTADTFIATIPVEAKRLVAVDNAANIHPIDNGQFTAGAKTYAVLVPIAYENAAGPYFQMVAGRFIVPRAAPLSSIAYTVTGGRVVKGFVVDTDDQFSVDGNVVYTVNETTVVRASNQATLAGAAPNQTLSADGRTYSLESNAQVASVTPAGLSYDTATRQFTVTYNGMAVTYTANGAGTNVRDNRSPRSTFVQTVVSGSQVTFTDTVAGASFRYDRSGNNPITVLFAYQNQFFIDSLNNITYYVDVAGNRVEALSYLPETTQYAFMPADGNIYLIHYSDVGVVFPVVAGPNVNAGIATIGANTFTLHIDEVAPEGGGAAIPVNVNSFEINGNLYTITGAPAGGDYSACQVVGAGMAPVPFLSPSTFRLTDPSVTYSLHLDAANLPHAVSADFVVNPSRNLISVNDNIYIITYSTVSTGTLQGQGQSAIAISDSRFTLPNPFDSTMAEFIFANLNIFNAGSVVGRFAVNNVPTFFLASATYTLDPVNLVVIDNDKRRLPLLPNPTMFSIGGFNYVIDSNRVPHGIVGNNYLSPLSTGVTVEAGQPIPNSTFTLNGQIYKYTEDAAHNLLTITGTRSYPIQQPALTFKLDSSLVFTLAIGAPGAGTFPGTIAPIGTVTAGSLMLNVYPGTSESGGADFFMYKNVLYAFVKSGATYLAVQKSYTVYAAHPVAGQQQLALFDLEGTSYIVTDGTTTGVGAAAGINPGTMWAHSATSATETQFGLVYGLDEQPTTVTRSATGEFQFLAEDAGGASAVFDVIYTAGGNTNVVKIDVPDMLPSFTQVATFNFVQSAPLTFSTGGYHAFTTFVEETATPVESFAGSYKTPILSLDPRIDTLIGPHGDFSFEFWHSIPLGYAPPYHAAIYRASSADDHLVYNLDVDFENASEIYVTVNNTVMRGSTTPPVFSSRWRHVGVTYAQPYTILCQGAGFEVKRASTFDFDRDFSVALTFAADDVTTAQGLLYKGTGSDVTSPELEKSYRVQLAGGSVRLEITDSNGNPATFTGPSIAAGKYYQVIVTKQTDTASPSSDTDPTAPPFDLGELAPAAQDGGSAKVKLPDSGDEGTATIKDVAPDTSRTPKLQGLIDNVKSSASKSYSVSISVREVHDDGTFGAWVGGKLPSRSVTDDSEIALNATGSAHLLIGAAYDDQGTAMPLGSVESPGNIREVYLFNTAIGTKGIKTKAGTVDIATASAEDLNKSGLIGHWRAQYDANGVINNPLNDEAVAVSTNTALAYLLPLTGHEREGTRLYVNGVSIRLELVPWSAAPASIVPYRPGVAGLLFFATGLYRLEEISLWRMTRQPYQIVDDMFGRLVPTNEPQLIVYLSGSFSAKNLPRPVLPMNQYIDHLQIENATPLKLDFFPASLDLTGSPAVGRCGPLITPNFYTPPGTALTVCDRSPGLATYSVTLNTVTGTLAGVINEVYAYVKDHVLVLYAGKKVGDLVLSWVGQEQGDVQIIGYMEGAPPAPMANLTLKGSYEGATSASFTLPTQVNLNYEKEGQHAHQTQWRLSAGAGVGFGIGLGVAPFGFGLHLKDAVVKVNVGLGYEHQSVSIDTDSEQQSASEQLEEQKRYGIELKGTLLPITGDTFMANINALSSTSNSPGAPSSKTAILPNPNLGGFTVSSPAAALPRQLPTEERYGERMYQPSPYRQAFVSSVTLDVYQQTLVQSNTVYGFVRVPNAQIPRDINIVSFRMSSKYIRPGVLDGMIGYAYNPATLPTGVETFGTSTGQMAPVYDRNFSAGVVGNNASYMRVVEAYRIKREIDEQTFGALAQYQTAYGTKGLPADPTLLPALDFYNEYVWTSRGATEEIKHSYSTTYQEIHTTSSSSASHNAFNFSAKAEIAAVVALDLAFDYRDISTDVTKYTYSNGLQTSFDIDVSFAGIEGDTQMRYGSNNDAHFVMNFNSMYNQNNQSGLNLVVGSDGLIYNIVPSVTSGAGLPVSDNIDTVGDYMQPQPAYTSGNANGLSGALEPYDRPGKTKQFRTYAFFRQGTRQNDDDFWDTVVDPVWLANSDEADARALRTAKRGARPWRMMYRVTYSERFLPPISTATFSVPQITPVMAVPVLERATDFLFMPPGQLPRPAHNPLNDVEANVVLAAPTASGASAGSAGPVAGTTILPNNIIPFDLVKTAASVVNWGDSANARLIARLLSTVLGLNTLELTTSVPAGATKVVDVMDPVKGGVLYTVYTDPNGLTVNVAVNASIAVMQDVNGNPVQYHDGQAFHSLQADYVASPDGTVMIYVQPPSTYDQSTFDLTGDYDLFGHPGDNWRYFLVSGMSANLTAEPTVATVRPFKGSTGANPYTCFTVADAMHADDGSRQVQGYVLAQGVLQWPHLNTAAEGFADVQVYKAMSLLDTFPIGDPTVLVSFLKAQYPQAPFAANDDINLVFAKNIVSSFNLSQSALMQT